MIKKPKKISEEIIHKNPWYVYKHDTYELSNGEIGNYYYSETPGSAMVVPVLPDGRIVLVRQYRYLNGKTSVEFPGGGIRAGESARQTAGIELKEETGYDVDELVAVGEFEPDNGFVKDRAHIFLAQVSQEKEPAPEPSEQIEVLARYPDEVEAMIQSNDIWDGQTLAAWSLVKHRL